MTHKDEYFFSCVFYDSVSWKPIADSCNITKFSIERNQYKSEAVSGFYWQIPNEEKRFKVEMILPVPIAITNLFEILKNGVPVCAIVKEESSLFRTTLFHDCIICSIKNHVDDVVTIELICSDIEYF